MSENYRQIYQTEHPEEDITGKHIHHLDGDRSNNDPMNLIAVSIEDHYKIHFHQRDFGAAALLSDKINYDAPTTSVRQYDLSGNFIEEFDSISLACEKLKNINPKVTGLPGNIVSCCKYNKKSFSNYQWFYTDEVSDLDFVGQVDRDPRGNNERTDTTPLGPYVLKENPIHEFKNQRECMLFLDIWPSGHNWKKVEYLFEYGDKRDYIK